MRFLWTTIHVTNLDRSIAFYGDLLGLQVKRRYAVGALELAFLGYERQGETELELIYTEVPQAFTDSVSIGFEVESLDAMQKTLEEKGIDLSGGPFVGDGHAFIFVKDPDGMNVQLFENRL